MSTMMKRLATICALLALVLFQASPIESVSTVTADTQNDEVPLDISMEVTHPSHVFHLILEGGLPLEVGAIELTIHTRLPSGAIQTATATLPMQYDALGNAELWAPLSVLTPYGDFLAEARGIYDVTATVLEHSRQTWVLGSLHVAGFDVVGHLSPASAAQIENDHYAALSGSSSSGSSSSSSGSSGSASTGSSSGAAASAPSSSVSNAFVADIPDPNGPTLDGSGQWFCSGPAGVFGAN